MSNFYPMADRSATEDTLMNPHELHKQTFPSLVASIIAYHELIFKLTRMDVRGRYKGSFLGLGWSFAIPLLMLAIYTFVFSFVFSARWGANGGSSRSQFALVLFAGLIVHGFLAEVLQRSPTLVLNNVNYVKKVVFPLEILSITTLLAALFHAAINVGVLVLGLVVINGYLHWTAIFAPLVLLPLCMLALGCSWLLASLGVYVRDIGQTIGIFMTVLLFLSPVFYPLSTLPQSAQRIMLLNPLTFVIEQIRDVIVFGNMPDWEGLALYTVISFCIMMVGFSFFQRTRKGFSDVL